MRVIIVDDHTLVRAGLSRLLQTFAGIDVVGEASNAQQALDMADLHRPDLILMDLSLPGRSGLDAMTDVLRIAPRTRVVMMSMHDDPAHVRDALDRGAPASWSRTRRRWNWNWRCTPPPPARCS